MVTFSLVVLVLSHLGTVDSYVADFGLSAEDCQRAAAHYHDDRPGAIIAAECTPEPGEDA